MKTKTRTNECGMYVMNVPNSNNQNTKIQINHLNPAPQCQTRFPHCRFSHPHFHALSFSQLTPCTITCQLMFLHNPFFSNVLVLVIFFSLFLSPDLLLLRISKQVAMLFVRIARKLEDWLILNEARRKASDDNHFTFLLIN